MKLVQKREDNDGPKWKPDILTEFRPFDADAKDVKDEKKSNDTWNTTLRMNFSFGQNDQVLLASLKSLTGVAQTFNIYEYRYSKLEATLAMTKGIGFYQEKNGNGSSSKLPMMRVEVVGDFTIDLAARRVVRGRGRVVRGRPS